ncbi:MAG: beta-xylosidase [Verrucomicrobiae bacterium]|nr:beta-xylosidase [Verrucomicrobiae bacterium]
MPGYVTPIWCFFGYDEPNYSYMPEGSQLLDEIAKLKPQPVHIRTHHLLTSGDGTPWLKWGSTGAYDETMDGKPIYNWTILDRIFDSFISRGLKPFVEIGFMPKALSVKPEPYTNPVVTNGPPVDAVGRGWAYPPKDYNKWSGLIEVWVRHCVEKYGRAEAASWFWELWNEPNIAYWRGSPEEYNKLYDYTVAAVKKVLPEARIGAPHTAGTQGGAEKFLRGFIEHCLRGTNYVTGRVGTPLDFVAFHAKGGTEFINGHVRMNLGNHLRIIDNGFRVIKSYPELKNIPIIIGESDPDGCAACSARFFPQNSYRNDSQYASYTVATFMRKILLAKQHGVNLQGAVTWAFEFENQPWFDGFRVLSTRGAPLPVFNAFRMFSMLGERKLKSENPSSPGIEELMKRSVRGDLPDVDAFATRSSNSIRILVWHYHDNGTTGEDVNVELTIDNLKPASGKARIEHYRIDENHSNAYTVWKKLGSPQNPTEDQIKMVKEASNLVLFEPGKEINYIGGQYSLKIPMPRQSISLIILNL